MHLTGLQNKAAGFAFAFKKNYPKTTENIETFSLGIQLGIFTNLFLAPWWQITSESHLSVQGYFGSSINIHIKWKKK